MRAINGDHRYWPNGFRDSKLCTHKTMYRVMNYAFELLWIFRHLCFFLLVIYAKASILSQQYFYDLIKPHKCDDMIINYGHQKTIQISTRLERKKNTTQQTWNRKKERDNNQRKCATFPKAYQKFNGLWVVNFFYFMLEVH